MTRKDISSVVARLHRARRELRRLEGRGEVSMKVQDLRWFIQDAVEMIEELTCVA